MKKRHIGDSRSKARTLSVIDILLSALMPGRFYCIDLNGDGDVCRCGG